MPHDMLLIAVIILPFVGSVLAALLRANAQSAEAWLSGSIALASLALSLALYPAVSEGGAIYSKVEWMPDFGLDFSVRMDGFAWMFAVLITGIGVLVVLYARYYMSPADPVAALLLVSAGLHGRHARHRALRQPDPARVLLGTDQPLLLPADRLLASKRPARETARAWR